MRQKDVDEIIFEIYQELYATSSPACDFKSMVNSGETKQHGFWNKYYLDDSKQEEIIDRIMDKHKVPKHIRENLKTTILLGCSPTGKDDGT